MSDHRTPPDAGEPDEQNWYNAASYAARRARQYDLMAKLLLDPADAAAAEELKVFLTLAAPHVAEERARMAAGYDELSGGDHPLAIETEQTPPNPVGGGEPRATVHQIGSAPRTPAESPEEPR